MASNLWLRLLILSLSLIGGVSWYVWGRRSRRLGEASFVFFWLLNVAAFHVYRIFGNQTDLVFLNNWSLSIHLQAALSLAIVGLLLLRGKR